MKELVRKIFNALDERDQFPRETLLPCLSCVPDINACILNSCISETKLRYISCNGLECTVESSSPQVENKEYGQHCHFSVLHLLVLIWIVESSSSASSDNMDSLSLFKSLEKLILVVASSGGDCDVQVRGIKILFHGVEQFRIDNTRGMTIREFISEFVRNTQPLQQYSSTDKRKSVVVDSKHNLTNRPHATWILEEVVAKAKELNPFSSLDSPQSLPAVWSKLLFSEDFSDVTIVCQDGTTYPVHELILSRSSQYFKMYFASKGQWCSSSSKQTVGGGGDDDDDCNHRQYKTEIDSTILEYILTYMYTGNFGTSIVALSPATICTILQTGQELQMAKLVNGCSKILESRIDLDTIKQIACFAFQYGPPNLWQHCVNFINVNRTDLLLPCDDIAVLKTERPDLWKKLETDLSKLSSPNRRKRPYDCLSDRDDDEEEEADYEDDYPTSEDDDSKSDDEDSDVWWWRV